MKLPSNLMPEEMITPSAFKALIDRMEAMELQLKQQTDSLKQLTEVLVGKLDGTTGALPRLNTLCAAFELCKRDCEKELKVLSERISSLEGLSWYGKGAMALGGGILALVGQKLLELLGK